MLLVYLLVLIVAAVTVVKREGSGNRGWSWFAAWAFAGALFAFSLVTGLSVGLLFLPAAAAILLFVAWHSPYVRESAGFFAGAGAFVVAALALV